MKAEMIAQQKSPAKRKAASAALKTWCPPCVLLENTNSYSVVLNLLGIDQRDILIDINNKKREFSVYAGKKTDTSNNAFFWVFGVPSSGQLDEMTVRYKAGGFEVTIPKRSLAVAA